MYRRHHHLSTPALTLFEKLGLRCNSGGRHRAVVDPTAKENPTMGNADCIGGSGCNKQGIKCRYLICAAEVIERTKSYDCVRVYHRRDAADAINSTQITNRPSPSMAEISHLESGAQDTHDSPSSAPAPAMLTSDRAQRRKEKKMRKKEKKKQLHALMKGDEKCPLSIRVTTTKFHSTLDTRATTRSIVHVKPLIVLDLNGILCHRVRTTPQTTSTAQTIYRPSCGNISSTDIIPRSDLVEFLTLLHGNFCLGVWTSATRKTSKLLIEALFPTNIRKRLIFVWHRSFCQLVKKAAVESSLNEGSERSMDCVDNESNQSSRRRKRKKRNEVGTEINSSEDGASINDYSTKDQSTTATENTNNTIHNTPPNGTIFQDDVTAIKSLSKVWAAFPLWDDTNTILLDDSPEKCPSKFRANSLHPPPIRGTVTACADEGARSKKDSYSIVDDDEANQRTQRDFFHLLAKHWEQPAEKKLAEFLEKHANNHNMRWKTEA